MSEQEAASVDATEKTNEVSEKTPPSSGNSPVEVTGLYAFKVGMTQVITDKGEMVPCTVLQYEPWTVSQIKTKEKDCYEAMQIACRPRRASRSSKAQQNALKKAGFKTGAYFVREIRMPLPQNVALGAPIALSSLKKGDVVSATSVSKGKGFAGSVKRWNAGGGPAAHGSCFHRQPGSSGNRTWPGRIMKGKHFPGHLGDETTTVRNLEIVDVYTEDNLILVSGCVPGAKNAIVKMVKGL
jgi:large subunit ribosomal protein L3